MNRVLIIGNQSSFEIMKLSGTWRGQKLILLWFESKMNQMVHGVCLVYWHSPALGETWLKLIRLPAIISLYLTTVNVINRIQHSCVRSLLLFFQFFYQRSLMWLAHSISGQSFIKLNSAYIDHFMNVQITCGKDNIYIALLIFINNAKCPNWFSFDGHPSISEFLLKV